MKNKHIVLIISFIFILVIILSLVLYSKSFTKNMNLDDKFIKEMQYISNQLISVMGQFNGISIGDYAIQLNASKVSPDNKEKANSKDNESKKQNTNDNENSNEDLENKKKEKEENINDDKPKEINQHQNYILSQNGDYETNWKFIEEQVENLYQIWNNICLDLLEENIDSKQITNFTNYLNTSIRSIKEKDKKGSMDNIVKLYNLLPEYCKTVFGENEKTIAFEIKAKVIESYSNVSNDNWSEAVKNIEDAELKFRNVINKDNETPLLLNQAYIIINELKKAIEIQDREVFFIQYRNLISRIQLVM